MNAKQFLSRAYKLNLTINSKLQQLEALRSLAYKVTSTLSQDKVSNGTRHKSPMENAIIKIIMAETEIEKVIDHFIDVKNEIDNIISLISDDNERVLLGLRYLCFNSWEQIAVEMGYSVRTIYRIHDKAIKNIDLLKVVTECHGMSLDVTSQSDIIVL